MHHRPGVPLAPLTTLRIGGPAARLVDLEREGDVADAVRDAEAHGEGLFVLGDGSNVVVADEGFPGLVARMATRGVEARSAAGRVVVDVAAGEGWDGFVARAVAEGWRGVECLSAIPGRVGATPIQNVGAYGQEVSETIVSVRAFDRVARAQVDLDPPACGFGYRASVFKRSDRWVVTRVTFAFEVGAEGAPVRYAELARALSVREGERAPARLVRETILALRRGKGMVLSDDDPDSVSAGSFFVNPVVDAAGLAAVEARAGERTAPLRRGRGAVQAGGAPGSSSGRGSSRDGPPGRWASRASTRWPWSTAEGRRRAAALLSCARSIRDGVRARFGA